TAERGPESSGFLSPSESRGRPPGRSGGAAGILQDGTDQFANVSDSDVAVVAERPPVPAFTFFSASAIRHLATG
ncbi:MAG: hypothetical protein ABL994_19535, partial [Verrucomicrobiales bacterium]